MINTTSNQLKILKELIELLKGKFDTLPTIEINPYQYNVDNIYTIPTINWRLYNFTSTKNINTTDALKDKELYFTVRDRAIGSFAEMVFHLKSLSQEEADTKMFLAGSFIMSIGFESVFIVTNDTDILALVSYTETCWQTIH